MRAVVQRVARASVRVVESGTEQGEEVGAIGPGFLILVGVRTDDTAEDARGLAQKIANLLLRIPLLLAMGRNTFSHDRP